MPPMRPVPSRIGYLIFLPGLVESDLVPLSQREPIYRKILELAQESASKSEGLTKEYAQNTYLSWQVRWIGYLLKTKQFERAKSELDALPKDTAPSVIAPLSLQIAARLNMLDKVLDAYRADPEHAPAVEVLRDAAKQL